jgi:hypothetical protein
LTLLGLIAVSFFENGDASPVLRRSADGVQD